MHLYEIDERIREILDSAVDPETGEINEGASIELDFLEEKREERLRGIAALIREHDAEAKAIKAEEERLAARRKLVEKRGEWLGLQIAKAAPPKDQPLKPKTKATRIVLDDPVLPITYKRSEAVKITDPDKVPRAMQSMVPASWQVDKALVKKALKGTDEQPAQKVPGAALEERWNLKIG